MSNPIQMKDALGVVIFKVKNYLFPDGEVGTAPVIHGPNGQPVFTVDQPAHVTLDVQAAGLSTSAGQASQLTQLQALVTALGGTLTVNAPNGARIPVDIGSATVTISGPVTVANEVEIKNDSGSPVPTAPQSNAPRKRQTGALAALNAAVTLPVDGMSTVLLKLSGAWVGTVALFGSADDGQTYDIPLTLIPYSGGAAVSAMSANGAWEMACGALTHVQAVMTAFTSGSASALLVAGAGAKSVRVGAPTAQPVPTREQNGVTPAQTFVATSAFASGNTAGAGGTNATVVQVVAANSNRTFLEIINNGTADAELWFGSRPADTAVGLTPKQGVVIAAGGGGRVYDARVPLGAVYVTTSTTGGLSVLEG